MTGSNHRESEGVRKIDREMRRKEEGGTLSLAALFVWDRRRETLFSGMSAKEEGQLVAPQPL